MEENKASFKTEVINFSRSITPLPIEVRQGTSDTTYIRWGETNTYPSFLLKLFNETPLHSNLISTKTNYLMGDGVFFKGGDKATFDINPVDSLEEVVRKLVTDFLLFNFYVIEVQYNLFNEPVSLNHIPAHHVRTNKSKTKFWVCDDWSQKKNILSYDRWTKNNEDSKSKIYMYSKYTPSVNNVYPVASYSPAITNMVTENLISDFSKNNLEDGFSGSHIISFFKGIPDSEEAKKLQKKFDEKFRGVNGLKYILNYNNPKDEKGVQVDSINPPEFANALTEIHSMNVESILTVHQATSRILFGIETPGSLGDKNSMENSYQIFKEVYIRDTRNTIEAGLNKILSIFGHGEIEFKDKGKLFAQELDTTTREKVLTINELRAIDGLEPLPDGNKLLSATATPAPAIPNQFSLQPDYSKGRILSEQDFEQVKHLGTGRENFEILSSQDMHFHSHAEFSKASLKFANETDIDNWLLENEINGKSLAEIKKDILTNLNIDVSGDDLTERIKQLTNAKLITSKVDSDGKIRSTPVKKGMTKVSVMYSYEVRPGYGKPLIDTSRGFCVKLIENDRLYTRGDIQVMSTIFGYDVHKHTGGWYFDGNEAVNHCRHEWKMVRVLEKGKGGN